MQWTFRLRVRKSLIGKAERREGWKKGPEPDVGAEYGRVLTYYNGEMEKLKYSMIWIGYYAVAVPVMRTATTCTLQPMVEPWTTDYVTGDGWVSDPR